MFARVFGVAVIIVGIGGLAFSVYAAVNAPSMVETLMIAVRAGVIELDAADWIERWRVTCAVFGAASAATVAGGSIIVSGRRSGFLLIAAVAACLASLPWIVEALGAARYAFEQGSIAETAVLSALAVAALTAYGWLKRNAA